MRVSGASPPGVTGTPIERRYGISSEAAQPIPPARPA